MDVSARTFSPWIFRPRKMSTENVKGGRFGHNHNFMCLCVCIGALMFLHVPDLYLIKDVVFSSRISYFYKNDIELLRNPML